MTEPPWAVAGANVSRVGTKSTAATPLLKLDPPQGCVWGRGLSCSSPPPPATPTAAGSPSTPCPGENPGSFPGAWMSQAMGAERLETEAARTAGGGAAQGDAREARGQCLVTTLLLSQACRHPGAAATMRVAVTTRVPGCPLPTGEAEHPSQWAPPPAFACGL